MTDAATGTTGRRRGGRTAWIVPAGLLCAAIGLAWWWYSGGRETTDDAQVDGDVVPIAAKVGGIVREVNVEDNEPVEAGMVLASIDPRDYQVALDRAQADVAEAQAAVAAAEAGVPLTSATSQSQLTAAQAGRGNAAAGIAVAERQIEAAHAKVAASQARVREAESNLAKATQDVQRLRPLAEKDEVSRQQFDAVVAAQQAAQAAADSARAAVAEAETGVSVAEARLTQARGELTQAGSAVQAAQTAPQQVAITRARAALARAQLAQAEAAVEQAELNLEYAVVRAASAGVVSRKTVKPGQIVQPGQPLMAMVPLEDIWVTANFKETQLDNVRVGQPVEIEVDAYGGRPYQGHIASIAPATGARFSLLPPENASGNFVKVVQRVPVRIAIEPGQDSQRVLRPGMSVVVTVFTR
ncbi:MAG: HlyD family secretion protein [Vicinamibacterales bacterium]